LAATFALMASDQGALMIEVMPAMIAAGCGLCGNEQAEKNAAHLPVDVQNAMFRAIMQLTMPQGVAQNPFVPEEDGGGGVSGKVPVTS
jgi:transcription elongation factor Elf1